MGNAQQASDLQVPEDLDFERRSRRVERIGWVVLSIIMGAALVGLLGNGPISAATAGAEDTPLRVQYGRFARHRACADDDQAAAGCCAGRRGTRVG